VRVTLLLYLLLRHPKSPLDVNLASAHSKPSPTNFVGFRGSAGPLGAEPADGGRG
jgi:hypothetical protein